MPTLLLSDVHADGPQDPAQRRLLALLADPPADRLILVGDVFHRWWSWGSRVFPAYLPLVQALSALARRGIRVDMVRGNHDFALSCLEDQGVRVVDSLEEAVEAVPAWVAHGDGADPTPGYRLTRSVLRGRAFAALLSRMEPDRAWRFLGRLAGDPHPLPRPAPDLVRACRARARAHLLAGARLVVLGHTHGLDDWSVPEGRYVNLGAFYHHGRALCVDGDRVWWWKGPPAADRG